jgi:lipid-A-disaccharide synthase
VSAEVLIVSNGPGELAAWVRPVVRRLRAELPQARVTVALVPCPYASGQEARAVAGWPEAPAVWTPRETLRYLALGRRPDGGPSAGEAPGGVVLFLGGDQLFATMLGRRAGYPVLVYTDGAARWRRFVRLFLAADRNTFLAIRAGRVREAQVRLAGNLMVDAVGQDVDPAATRRELGLRPDAPVLGLLPGSKPFKVRWVTPLFLRVAELLQARDPGLQVVLHRSPFTPREQLVDAVENPVWRAATGGIGGSVVEEDGMDWILTPGGGRVRVLPPEIHQRGLAVADVALTVPGTNTAELAILGVPMVVALPLHKPEAIPLDGLVGRIGALPVVGPALMRAIARRFVARKPLVALPNQRAGQAVTPELIGVFTPEDLADAAGTLVGDPLARREVKLRLHQVMGSPGAAAAVVAAVRETLLGSAEEARSGSS